MAVFAASYTMGISPEKIAEGFIWKKVLVEMYNLAIASNISAMDNPHYKMNLKTTPLSSPGFWTDS